MNSTEGFVRRTLDLSISSPLKVCAEIDFRVQQNLMSIETALDGIRRCTQHAQSLAQTAGRLSRHLPNAERVPVASECRGGVWRPRRQARPQCTAGEMAAARTACRCCSATLKIRPTTRRASGARQQDVAASGRDKTSLILRRPTGSAPWWI